MILKADASGLEWRAAIDLARDELAIDEVRNNFDIHADNQRRFKFPPGDDGRRLAKIFLYRLIYGGSAYSYSVDPNFNHVSSSQKFWDRIIGATYEKYVGLGKWHTDIVRTVTEQGFLEIPSGRKYEFQPMPNPYGGFKWPRTTILNYPVQGFSADLMMIIRLTFFNRINQLSSEVRQLVKIINTIHDDIQVDVDNQPELCYNICRMLEDSFSDCSTNVKRIFDYDLKVPLAGEVSFGNNLKEMTKFDKTKDITQLCL